MTTEPRSKSQSAKHPAVLKLMGGAPFSQRMQQVYDTLARRAYELFESRGRQDGQDLEDWFRAESELLNQMPVEISEADDQEMCIRDRLFTLRLLVYESMDLYEWPTATSSVGRKAPSTSHWFLHRQKWP